MGMKFSNRHKELIHSNIRINVQYKGIKIEPLDKGVLPGNG
jgi:hypothetical protein